MDLRVVVLFRRTRALMSLLAVALITLSTSVAASTTDIVLLASEAPVVHGHWVSTESDGAAGGRSMASADTAWASATAPVAAPTHFFEMTFDAPAGVTYRVWLRMRARDNS